MARANWSGTIRFIYWSLSVFFIFMAAVMVISILKPGPTETQVMRWMSGMMAAMHSSLMGASMDSSETFRYLLNYTAGLSALTMVLGITAGVALKLWRKYD